MSTPYQVEFVFKDIDLTPATSHLFIFQASAAAAITAAVALASAYQLVSDMNLEKVNLIVPITGYTSAAAATSSYSAANNKMITENQTAQANSQVRLGVPGPKATIVGTGTNNPLVTAGAWATFIAAVVTAAGCDKYGNLITNANPASGFLKSKRRKRTG